jgi:hypothetical protein
VRCHDGRVRQPQRFFEAQFVGMGKLPNRPVVHLQSAFGNEAAQGEVAILDPLQDKRLGARLKSLSACDRPPGATLPVSCWRFTQMIAALMTNPKLLGRLVTRHAAAPNSRSNPLAQINRIRLAHPFGVLPGW